MARLREEEIRRLLSHLKQYIREPDRLAGVEDELRGEYGAEFLREPDLLVYFQERQEEITASGTKWLLRIIPYTHMRMIQRGIQQASITSLFQRFIEFCTRIGETITVGPYTIYGRPEPRSSPITLRADIDVAIDTGGHAHTVTVFLGKGESEGTMEIELP
jgi:hypothetical protein